MKRTSQTITFRVYSDTDALVLETLMSMTEGERSDFIRESLREKITGQLVAAPTPESSPFDEIMRQLSDIQNRLAQGVPIPSAAPVVVDAQVDSGLSSDQLQRRSKKLARADW